MIRAATLADLGVINEIYNYYVEHSTCTYQNVPSTMEEREAWFVRSAVHPVRVMEVEGRVVGWHSLSAFKAREAYARTVENSIYVAHDQLGKGYGKVMLGDQLDVAKGLGHHAVLAVICASQGASIRLHEGFGFERAAYFREVGFKFGKWLDVVVMEKII